MLWAEAGSEVVGKPPSSIAATNALAGRCREPVEGTPESLDSRGNRSIRALGSIAPGRPRMDPPRIRQGLRRNLSLSGHYGRQATKGNAVITTRNMKTMAGKAILAGGVELIGLGLASGTAQAFDPQPDPPGKPSDRSIIAVNPADSRTGGTVAFNPQPEPPVRSHIAVGGGA